VKVNGKEGVPLSELDLSGEAPREVILLGPDTVDIRDGEKLAIEVQGSDEAKGRMRFVLGDGSLGILREKGQWTDGEAATVILTMPAPARLSLAGSGRMKADSVSDRPEINAARVARRVLQGGHEVPIRKIVDRWGRSIANAASVAAEVDRFYVYDNSVDDRDAQLVLRAADGRVVKSYGDAPAWAEPILERLAQRGS